jgi:hypothetical protein
VGSVASLYTTGDNDPEIHPTPYYRHFFYCDACGAFALESWVRPQNHQSLETLRHRLARAASYVTLPTVIAGWLALRLSPGLSFVAVLIFGIALYIALRSLAVFLLPGGREEIAQSWGLAGRLLLWALGALVSEALVLMAPWQYWVSALAGAALLAGLLIWREVVGSRIEVVGVRCRACGATYRNGSSFLTDLDANPRGLTVADVPRPEGSSYFRDERTVEPGS